MVLRDRVQGGMVPIDLGLHALGHGRADPQAAGAFGRPPDVPSVPGADDSVRRAEEVQVPEVRP
jgi:hypothetical protein